MVYYVIAGEKIKKVVAKSHSQARERSKFKDIHATIEVKDVQTPTVRLV